MDLAPQGLRLAPRGSIYPLLRGQRRENSKHVLVTGSAGYGARRKPPLLERATTTFRTPQAGGPRRNFALIAQRSLRPSVC